jgi:hypothetical protein
MVSKINIFLNDNKIIIKKHVLNFWITYFDRNSEKQKNEWKRIILILMNSCRFCSESAKG